VGRPELLGWYEPGATAPADFHTRWRPPNDDPTANDLLRALGGVLTKQTETTAAELAVGIDAFLGHEVDPAAYHAVALPDWVEAPLYGLADWRLPAFGAAGTGGLRLVISRSPENGVPPRLEVEGVSFDQSALLRLMPDRPNRRINFLRELGGRMQLTDVVPAQVGALGVVGQKPGEMIAFVWWVLDILHVDAEDAALADMVVYLVGGREDLLFPFLRSVFAVHPSRDSTVNMETLARAWEQPSLREAAQAALLDPLTADPLARAALSAILCYCRLSEADVSESEVAEALLLYGADPDQATVREALERLVACGLLARGADQGNYRALASGVTSLLLASHANSEAFLKDALCKAGWPC